MDLGLKRSGSLGLEKAGAPIIGLNAPFMTFAGEQGVSAYRANKINSVRVSGRNGPLSIFGEAGIANEGHTGQAFNGENTTVRNAMDAYRLGLRQMACTIGEAIAFGGTIPSGPFAGQADGSTLTAAWATEARRDAWVGQCLTEAEAIVAIGEGAAACLEPGGEMFFRGPPEKGAVDAPRVRDARIFGVMMARVCEAIQSKGITVPVVACLHACLPSQPHSWGEEWTSGMLAEAPQLKTLLGGLTWHPYGERLTDAIYQQAYASSQGIQSPVAYMTEYGYEYNYNKTSDQANLTASILSQMVAQPWLRGAWFFNFCDNPLVAWSASATFNLGEVVYYPGSTPRAVYRCNLKNVNKPPPTNARYWTPIREPEQQGVEFAFGVCERNSAPGQEAQSSAPRPVLKVLESYSRE